MATVLIADDSRVQQQQMRNWLTDAGHKVISALDCFQAWNVAVTTPIDGMILDLNMPAGNGIDVLKRLKSSWKTSQIPVLVVTGNEADYEPLTKSMGAVEYLRKPLSFETFSAGLSKLIPATILQ